MCGAKFNDDSETESKDQCPICKGKTQRIVKIECTIDCGAIGMTKQDAATIIDYFTKTVLGRGFDLIDIEFFEKCRWKEIPIQEDIKRLQDAGLLKK